MFQEEPKDPNGVPMVATPSIEGSVFAAVVEDVNQLLGRAELSDDELARWLVPSDRELLAASTSISSWYDIRACGRMSALLRDVAGEGDDHFWEHAWPSRVVFRMLREL